MTATQPHGPLAGLHHVTAVTAHARENLAFYTTALGMRLVKKTVNQDDTSAYHLFYADAAGHPGTDLTFFDWPMMAPGKYGPGSIAGIGLRVNGETALEWWHRRLTEKAMVAFEIRDRGGRATLKFKDAEGQTIILSDDAGATGGTPWDGTDVPAEFGVRGLGPILIMEAAIDPTGRFLTETLGFRQSRSYTDTMGDGTGTNSRETEVVVFETGPGGVGAEVHVAIRPDLPRGRLGRGGVHHVAFRTPDDAHHAAWQHVLASAGVHVTPVIDRFYFRSLYFREPGGVLFEIATDGPGFSADEPIEHLGEKLSLPPFLEPRRAEIEQGLAPL